MKWFCYIFVVLLISAKFLAHQLRQEGAVVNYCNPKYVSQCYAITRRIKRGEPYRTNYTANTLHTWNNNVTMRILIHSTGSTIELMKVKLCDAMEVNWISNYYKTYSVGGIVCPFKPGLHGLYNMEFPPKNMPQQITQFVKGQFYTKFHFLITKTEETIIESTIILRNS